MIPRKFTDGIMEASQRFTDIAQEAFMGKRAFTDGEKAELKAITGKLKEAGIIVADHNRQHGSRRTFINELAEFTKAADSLARKRGIIKPEACYVLLDSWHLLANEIRLECSRGFIHTSDIISADAILDAKRLLNETRLAVQRVGSEQCRRNAENVSLTDALNDLYTATTLVASATDALYQIRNVFSDAVFFAVAAMTSHEIAIGFFDNPDLSIDEWTDTVGDWHITRQLKELFDLAQRFKDGIPTDTALEEINRNLMLERPESIAAWFDKRRTEAAASMENLKGKP